MSGIEVTGLHVRYPAGAVLTDVALQVSAGRIHVVLGVSGSGKTTLLRALLGLVPEPGQASAARMRLVARDGTTYDLTDYRVWQHVRGQHIGMVFQDPPQALTPLRRVGSLARESNQPVSQVLQAAGLADVPEIERRHCYELSGGMAQRLGLGLAIAPKPTVLLADEPSTALDGLAKDLLAQTLRASADAGTAVVLVTHDVSMARQLADDISVLDRGEVVETGPAAKILQAPSHPASRQLIDSADRRVQPSPYDATSTAALEIRGLVRSYPRTGPVLRGVDLEVGSGEVVGVLGRSGAGKTTLIRCIVGLERAEAGTMRIGGDAPQDVGWKQVRRRVQLVPQAPRASLNPWRTVVQLVTDSLDAHRIGDRRARRDRAEELLERIGMTDLAHRRPGELSTGQCQRVALARALAIRPTLLIADEPVTALDAPLRADALRLLQEMVTAEGTAMLIVAHELTVLEQLCHRIAVLDEGRIVETLPTARLRTDASQPLTRALIEIQETHDHH